MAWRYQCEYCNDGIESGDEVSELEDGGYYIACPPCAESPNTPIGPEFPNLDRDMA